MEHEHRMDMPDQLRERRKFYGLNLLILLVAVGLTTLQGDADIFDYIRNFMGLAWLVYAGFQLMSYRLFVSTFQQYDLIAKRIPAFAYTYPFIEIVWGITSLFDIEPFIRNLSVLIVMSIGVAGVVQSLRSDNHLVNCACLGRFIQLPLSRLTLYEDLTMAVLAIVMLTFSV